MNDIVNYFSQLPSWELLAVILSIVYVVLVAQNNIWCWPAAFISTLIFTILFFDVSLLMESFLNGYYMAMAVYGWYRWHNSKNLNLDNELPICSWSISAHILLISCLSVLSLILGYVMETYTSADFAYLDTFTTVFAIATTYLVTIKLLENWWYWIVINAMSVYLFLQKGLEPTAFLAVINIMMCFVGIYKWHKIYVKQLQQTTTVTVNAT